MKILQYRAYVLFLSLGLVIFFLGALLVVLVRTKSSTTVVMPSLVGKNYSSVHNELVRLRLKIILEASRIPEKNDGEVLSQSVPPGKELEIGSHVYVTVNQGFDRVEVPNLKGQTLERGKELLSKVLSGDIYVTMPIGGITYIPFEEGEGSGIILDQIPEPGKITHSGEKIYLLVTESSKSSKESQSYNHYIDQPFPLVAKSLNRRKVPWKISSFDDSKRREDSGLVSSLEDGGSIQFSVKRGPDGNLLKGQYEFWEWEIPTSGTFQVQLVKGIAGELESYVLPQSYKSGEKLLLAYYREGNLRANLLSMDGSHIKKKSWEIED